jgi:hypothetical protein
MSNFPYFLLIPQNFRFFGWIYDPTSRFSVNIHLSVEDHWPAGQLAEIRKKKPARPTTDLVTGHKR